MKVTSTTHFQTDGEHLDICRWYNIISNGTGRRYAKGTYILVMDRMKDGSGAYVTIAKSTGLLAQDDFSHFFPNWTPNNPSKVLVHRVTYPLPCVFVSSRYYKVTQTDILKDYRAGLVKTIKMANW